MQTPRNRINKKDILVFTSVIEPEKVRIAWKHDMKYNKNLTIPREVGFYNRLAFAFWLEKEVEVWIEEMEEQLNKDGDA